MPFELTLDNASPDDGNMWLFIELTPPLSPGVSTPPRGAFRLLQSVFDPSAFYPIDLTSRYAAAFGAAHAGQRAWMRLSWINEHGFKSLPVIFRVDFS